MSGVEVALIATAAVGTGVTIYGQLSGANAEKEAREQKAALDELTAIELLEREAYNETALRENARVAELQYGSSAMGGEDMGIGARLSINQQLEKTISITKRDADFKARMIRAGAAMERDLASDQYAAAGIGAFGTLLTGATRAASLYRPSTASTGLPKPAAGS
jgi:hypothetical protein